MSGQFKVDGSGNVELKETDGIDYAPVTVQLPGGERVPFLFSVKELDAKVGNHVHALLCSSTVTGAVRCARLRLVHWYSTTGLGPFVVLACVLFIGTAPLVWGRSLCLPASMFMGVPWFLLAG